MLLSASNIVKYHNDKCILNDVFFSIEEQDKIALIGVNGTGKSTFLKIVAGKETYEGEIISKNGLRISMLSQDTAFDDEETILEAMHRLCDLDTQEYEMKSSLNHFKMTSYDARMKTLSGGQKKRVALAAALLKKCDLLILDEPTNHLDYEMIEYLESFLLRFRQALLLVTHDRYFLERITNRIFEIDRSHLYEYEANYSAYLKAKMIREEIALAQEKKRNAFLKKELEWVRAGVQARGTKSKDRLDRYEQLSSIQKLQQQKQVNMISVHSRLGKKTIEIEDLGMGYGNTMLFSHFSYHFRRFERVGIIGVNGCGKTTLLKIIAKEMKALEGNITYGETIHIGYFAQDNQVLKEEMRVIDYLKEISDDLQTDQGRFSAKMMLDRFLFDDHLQYAKINTLSGGEKRRLHLLKVLMEAPNVLVLDEPTNDLDLTTLQILEDYLDAYEGIVIVVSHDRYFLDRICESLLIFKDGMIQSAIGGYSVNVKLDEKPEKEEKDGAKRYQEWKQSQKRNQPYMSSKEKKELAMMDDVIASLEKQIHDLDEQMEMMGSDYEKIQELSNQREALEMEMQVKSERYLELLELEENIQKSKR